MGVQPRLLKAKEIIQGTFTGFLFHREDHSQVKFIQSVPALGVANTHMDSPRCPPRAGSEALMLMLCDYEQSTNLLWASAESLI